MGEAGSSEEERRGGVNTVGGKGNGGWGWAAWMDECKKGDRESGRVGGDRSVSVKDETHKQVSERETDRRNTLGTSGRVRKTIAGP